MSGAFLIQLISQPNSGILSVVLVYEPTVRCKLVPNSPISIRALRSSRGKALANAKHFHA
jgi:hypothetical protein